MPSHTDIPNEYTRVEQPFLEQLKSMNWQHIEGDLDVPYLAERESFRDVLLMDRLRDAVRKINVDENGNPWLDDRRISQAVENLQRLGSAGLMEANRTATDLLLKGAQVEGDPNQRAGHKVRKLIDDHIISKGIDPKVPPISITDAGFEAAVDAHVSPRTRASEMEHAARYHISAHFHEDPAYYKKLSERLEAILQEFEDNWDELVRAMQEFIHDLREGRQEDTTGLHPQTQAPFLGILMEEADASGVDRQEALKKLVPLTVDLVEHIKQEIGIRDFWRNTYRQEVLRGYIAHFLDEHDVTPFDRQERVADRLVHLAKARHVSLTS